MLKQNCVMYSLHYIYFTFVNVKRIHLVCDIFISNICDKYGMGFWFGLVVIPIILVDNYNKLITM